MNHPVARPGCLLAMLLACACGGGTSDESDDAAEATDGREAAEDAPADELPTEDARDGEPDDAVEPEVDVPDVAPEAPDAADAADGPDDPDPPEFAGLVAAYPCDGKVVLEWRPATDDSPPILYRVFQSAASGAFDWDAPVLETAGLTATVEGLPDGTAVFFAVRAVDAAGNMDGNVAEIGVTPVAAYPTLPLMQTETVCGNHPWEAGFDPDRPPNDHAYGELTWGRIRDYLRAGVRSYMAWNMVLDTEGKNLDSERPWPQNALLVVDRPSRRLVVTPAYWAFRHFSGFVGAGAVRVGLSGTHEDGVAFRNPDGRLVVVLQNAASQPKTLVLGMRGERLQVDLPAHGWASVTR